jgi:hypothetical protein
MELGKTCETQSQYTKLRGSTYNTNSLRKNKKYNDDGTETEGGPGDVAIIPPGHNSWVVGDKPCVGIDFTGVEDWVKVH